MHVRFSSCRGLAVVEEGRREAIGTIADLVIHPDTGRIEGFFVRLSSFFGSETLFLSSQDVRHWGMRVTLRDADVLHPVDDVIRLAQILESGRTVLGQPIRTEEGRSLGRCNDVQFSTTLFMVEWLYPRRFLRWGEPIALSDVLEVRSDAIVVRGQVPAKAPLPSFDLGLEPPAT